jgi:hypothetical protein
MQSLCLFILLSNAHTNDESTAVNREYLSLSFSLGWNKKEREVFLPHDTTKRA